MLIDACYDTLEVQNELQEHADERAAKMIALSKIKAEEKKKKEASKEIIEKATAACREANLAELNSNNEKKTAKSGASKKVKLNDEKSSNKKSSSGDSSTDPTPSQVQAMVEQLMLMENFDLDKIFPDTNQTAEGDDNNGLSEWETEASIGVVGSRGKTLEASKRKAEKESLLHAKQLAEQNLLYALHEKCTEKSIKNALKDAQRAKLIWDDDEEGRCCTELVFKAYKQLHNLEQAAVVAKAVREHEEALVDCFVRAV